MIELIYGILFGLLFGMIFGFWIGWRCVIEILLLNRKENLDTALKDEEIINK